MNMIAAVPLNGATRQAADHRDLPHVLLVVDQFGEVLGGGERQVLKLASLLPLYGYRVSILTFSAHPGSAVFNSCPCPLYLLPLQRTYDLRALRAAFTFRRFVEQKRIKIVQTFFESSDIWAGSVTRKMTGARLIWSRRDMGILRTRKHEIAYRMMNQLPDAVFAVSEQVRQHCIEVDGISPDRALTVYNGLDLSDWQTAVLPAKSSDEIVVTTVGNIRHVKGHDTFIRAASRVAEKFPEVSFSIAGDVLEPAYFAELQALVRELGLAARFHFSGDVSDLRAHLSAADIFVLPSRSEGFSNALIEAMAASLPVVATNVGGNAEAVENGVNGWIVPPDDVVALGDAIIRLLADPSGARAMGAAGRKIAAERFTTEAMMRTVTAAYSKILASR